MVQCHTQASGHQPNQAAHALPTTSSTAQASTSSRQDLTADGLQAVRQAYELQGISQEVSDFLMQAWREGTQQQYGVYLRQWSSFCSESQVSVFSPTLNQVLQFLWVLFSRGLSYSAINTARSALSAVVSIDNTPIGQHRLVSRFLKSVFEQRLALPKNVVVWDASQVLNYLRSLSPVARISTKLLTLKLTMLILLLLEQRQQTVQYFDVRNMTLPKFLSELERKSSRLK